MWMNFIKRLVLRKEILCGWNQRREWLSGELLNPLKGTFESFYKAILHSNLLGKNLKEVHDQGYLLRSQKHQSSIREPTGKRDVIFFRGLFFGYFFWTIKKSDKQY